MYEMAVEIIRKIVKNLSIKYILLLLYILFKIWNIQYKKYMYYIYMYLVKKCHTFSFFYCVMKNE